MKVIDPGHEYLLDALDGGAEQRLVFVKREGPLYPGNAGSHPGTTTQEVLRALLERLRYVYCQLPCEETAGCIRHLSQAVWLLEKRAADRHGRPVPGHVAAITGQGACRLCGHVGCGGACRPAG